MAMNAIFAGTDRRKNKNGWPDDIVSFAIRAILIAAAYVRPYFILPPCQKSQADMATAETIFLVMNLVIGSALRHRGGFYG
jgi:hypothetical protein